MEEKIMTTYERLNELKANFNAEQETTKEVYLETEAELVKLLGEYIDKAPVSCKLYGNGKVVAVTGNTLEDMIVDIAIVDDTTRRFSLLHIMNNTFVKFEDDSEINEIWNSAFEVHTNLTNAYRACEAKARQLAIEEAKKIEAEKKAEEKYQRQREKALKDFEDLSNKSFVCAADDDFYYALGWLTKHVGTVAAALPDYLGDSFHKYFGTNTPCRVVDSKKRGPAGWQSQWSWSFSATLKKVDMIPAILRQYLNPKGNAVTDTAFVWDLVDNYGFQFGKKQDEDKIAKTIPAKYINSFNTGLTA
jgi:hypothetical protein